jgi:two-component system LytT family response regulator
MRTLRLAVVDDEAIARRRLRRLLASLGGARIVAEAGDGDTAVDRIARAKPDLVLLDVEMPGCDGLDVARRLPAPRPLVVFVTAYDRYALQAFDVHAVGYLLKPVSRERLGNALDRARQWLAGGSAVRDPDLRSALEDLAQRPSALRRVPIRANGRVELLDVDAIDWVEAADNYVVLHAGRRTHVLREALSRFEASLDPDAFVRIHRSAIVRLDRIERLETLQRGDYGVMLRDGTRLSLSRTHRVRLERALGRRL